jgi:hypothetical protein
VGKSAIPGQPGSYVTLDSKGMRDLLKSSAIASVLRSRMGRVQAALPGSELRTAQRPTRVVAQVWYGSKLDEANNGLLRRALPLSGGSPGRNKTGMRRSSG